MSEQSIDRDIQKLKFARLLLSEVLENLNEAYENKTANCTDNPTTNVSKAAASIKLSRAAVEIGWVSSALERVKEKGKC